MNDPMSNLPATHPGPAPRRRRVVASLCLAFIGSASQAQADRSTPKRVGLLFRGSRDADSESYEVRFLEAMTEQGSKVGRDFVLVRGDVASEAAPDQAAGSKKVTRMTFAEVLDQDRREQLHVDCVAVDRAGHGALGADRQGVRVRAD